MRGKYLTAIANDRHWAARLSFSRVIIRVRLYFRKSTPKWHILNRIHENNGIPRLGEWACELHSDAKQVLLWEEANGRHKIADNSQFRHNLAQEEARLIPIAVVIHLT